MLVVFSTSIFCHLNFVLLQHSFILFLFYPTYSISFTHVILVFVSVLLSISVFLSFYLPPVAKGRDQEIIKCLPYMCVHACIRLSCFYINLNISFIFYKDIFTKFVENVYGYENLSVHNFGLILKNKMTAIANCLKVIKVL